MSDEVNPRTGQCYYCGTAADVKIICQVLNLDGGRLQKVTADKIYHYMDLSEQTIDGYLDEFYFTPIRPYNQYMPNGVTKSVFPGRLRRAAQYLAAGLMLQSEFQAMEPNANEAVTNFIADSKKEIYQMTLFNVRLPGQALKSALRVCPPTMYPAQPPSEGMFS